MDSAGLIATQRRWVRDEMLSWLMGGTAEQKQQVEQAIAGMRAEELASVETELRARRTLATESARLQQEYQAECENVYGVQMQLSLRKGFALAG